MSHRRAFSHVGPGIEYAGSDFLCSAVDGRLDCLNGVGPEGCFARRRLGAKRRGKRRARLVRNLV